jgi:mono/diheme cytochrome c family protein
MKENNNRGFIFNSALLALLALALLSCDRSRNNPGWDYFPDMFYSTAYESYSGNPNFKDDMTMRTPPDGTVPVDYTPFDYTLDPESRIKAGKDLVNPFVSSEENVARGRSIYGTFCLGCHGAKGEGDGRLFTSKLYPLKPRSLVAASAADLKDGEIYHTITLGFGSMGAHGGQVRPDDRWKLVLYIRTLQNEAKGQLTTKNQAR